MNPKVSVIVPVYNGEKYLCQCIDSILNQQLKEIEVILVNDGSSDNSGKICDDYATKDQRVRVLHIENQGVSNARNRGIEISSGDFIAFVDADDWIDEQMYMVMLEKITKEKADIIICSHITFDGESEQLLGFPWKNDCLFERETIKEKVIPAFISNMDINGKKQQVIMGSVWKCLFSKDLIRKNSIQFDTRIRYTEDLIFILYAFSKSQKVVFITHPYYHYRCDIKIKSATTQRYIKNAYSSLKLSQEYIYRILQEFDILGRMSKQIEWRNTSNVLMCVANLFAEGCPYTFKEKIKETRFFIKDSKFKKSIEIIGTSDFSPKQKILVMLLTHSLVSVVITYYTLKHKFAESK